MQGSLNFVQRCVALWSIKDIHLRVVFDSFPCWSTRFIILRNKQLTLFPQLCSIRRKTLPSYAMEWKVQTVNSPMCVYLCARSFNTLVSKQGWNFAPLPPTLYPFFDLFSTSNDQICLTFTTLTTKQPCVNPGFIY